MPRPPRTTQGLLIGLWYATFSIRYPVVDVLDSYITERILWLICEGVKGFLILVSLMLFLCLSRHYHYRQRDEIVNVQGMIEDTHEKWLDQEEYMQERRALLGNLNANNHYCQQPLQHSINKRKPFQTFSYSQTTCTCPFLDFRFNS